MGGGAGGSARAGRRAHRLRQDARGVPVGAGPAGGRRRRPPDPRRRCRVLYVSPLKALAVDVQRNLRSPLTGIRQAAQRLGLPPPDITVGMRTGDTPADERRLFARTPPDVLVTTPESLFLLLTSAARESLRGVQTVIVDEVHAVAGTKRGAHLALSLERLDALLGPASPPSGSGCRRRSGRSTRSPRSSPAARPVRGRAAADPEDDRGARSRCRCRTWPRSTSGRRRAARTRRSSGRRRARAQRPSIWPAVERRLLELVREHRSTIVFANSRRLAERLTARLNELAAEEAEEAVELDAVPGRGASAQSGIGGGGDRRPSRKAHHGSMSREQRTVVEEELKAGRAAVRGGHVVAWSWASTWARSTWWCRWRRRRAWRPGCSGSAGPGTRSARCRAGWCSPSTGATWCRARWSPSG